MAVLIPNVGLADLTGTVLIPGAGIISLDAPAQGLIMAASGGIAFSGSPDITLGYVFVSGVTGKYRDSRRMSLSAAKYSRG